MTLQVLIVTMNQSKGDHSLLDRMNIQSDAIICNQCDRWEFEEFDYKGHHIQWFSFAERGVGLNRNNCLMRATADIVLFADDDVIYDDGYEDVILNYYESNPKADVAIFNLNRKGKNGEISAMVSKDCIASQKDITKYGTVFVSGRREKLHFHNIMFHLQFGGGTKYSCGEDTLFLQECYLKGLHIYTTVKTIGIVKIGDSSWFKGYTDKFFFDKGVLYYLINSNMAVFYALYHCFKHRQLYHDYGWGKAFIKMRQGILKGRREC